MQSFKTGAVRDIGGKGRMDLLPMCALLRLAKYYEMGCSTHGERNWEKGIPMHSFLDSAIRHLVKYMDGWTDEDHLCAAAWNIMSAMWTEEKRPDMQDIPSRASSLASVESAEKERAGIAPQSEVQGKSKEEAVKTCPAFYVDPASHRQYCQGTPEPCQETDCNGDKRRCNYYDYPTM